MNRIDDGSSIPDPKAEIKRRISPMIRFMSDSFGRGEISQEECDQFHGQLMTYMLDNVNMVEQILVARFGYKPVV